MKFNLNAENINYVKITYKDSKAFTHCIKAAVRFIGEYELLACVKTEEDLNIVTPQEVSIGIACDNGLYKADTTLKKVEKEDESYILFSLRKPEDTEYQQKREYFRVKIHESITVIFEQNEEVIKYPAITYDISANGVRIELDKNMTFPKDVRLLLFLPDKTVDVKAQYIRSDDEDQITKAAFRFKDIPQADLDYISQVCFRKQLEERRKNLL